MATTLLWLSALGKESPPFARLPLCVARQCDKCQLRWGLELLTIWHVSRVDTCGIARCICPKLFVE